ncbi:hypothetical protein Dimus_004431 [Dionaea muscipula]
MMKLGKASRSNLFVLVISKCATTSLLKLVLVMLFLRTQIAAILLRGRCFSVTLKAPYRFEDSSFSYCFCCGFKPRPKLFSTLVRQSPASKLDLPLFTVAFSSGLGKLYRNKQLYDLAKKELHSVKQVVEMLAKTKSVDEKVLSEKNESIFGTCLRCQLILDSARVNAEKVWQKFMNYMRLDVVAYNTAIHAIGLSEGVDFSIPLYKEMMESGCKHNVATYNVIIKLLCENGRMKEAIDMLREMHRKACHPNVIIDDCFFRSLVKPNEILRLFEKMIESGVRPGLDTYVMLMRKFGKWGFLRPLFIVWDKMEQLGCSPDESAYNALIDALVEKGMLDMAKKYDEEMLAKGLSAKPRVELESGDVHL